MIQSEISVYLDKMVTVLHLKNIDRFLLIFLLGTKIKCRKKKEGSFDSGSFEVRFRRSISKTETVSFVLLIK